ncbi:MAG: L-lactate dehydrogenase complex protein LldF [Actinomycetota bacterium]|jgi:L-lactate dehydrogenase complex protein LldG
MTSVRETGDRAAFLSTIRRAIAASHGQFTRPVEPLVSPLPLVEYVAEHGTLAEQFTTALTLLGGVVRRVVDGTTLAAVVDDALGFARRDDERVRVVLSDDPDCDRLRSWLAQRDDVEVLDYDNAATVATADLGITGARGAVALTGSVVVDAAFAGGRTVSLLPPVHLVLVDAASIVAAPGDLWRAMRAPMPSNLVQITGPSRSADIELIITLGVHGPRALWVGLLT